MSDKIIKHEFDYSAFYQSHPAVWDSPVSAMSLNSLFGGKNAINQNFIALVPGNFLSIWDNSSLWEAAILSSSVLMHLSCKRDLKPLNPWILRWSVLSLSLLIIFSCSKMISLSDLMNKLNPFLLKYYSPLPYKERWMR